jgi:hypothetical protein
MMVGDGPEKKQSLSSGYFGQSNLFETVMK